MRALIGGVGYRNLRDHSVGVEVTDTLGANPGRNDVHVEDLSYNAVAVAQWLETVPQAEAFDRAIFVGAVERDHEPGTVIEYLWDRELPDPERIQAAIGDAITGVINLDNTLIILQHFGVLPDETVVVEIEPLLHEFGAERSPVVESAFQSLCERAMELATVETAVAELAVCTLGGGPTRAAGPPE